MRGEELGVKSLNRSVSEAPHFVVVVVVVVSGAELFRLTPHALRLTLFR